MKRLLLTLLLSAAAFAQVPVALSPVPRLQFLDNNGHPLANGCIFTYQTNTVTPLTTYTDNTGTTANANPVVLTAGGFANLWLQAGQAYTLKVVSFGGVNCISGTTQYTVNGVGGSGSYQVTNVAFSATPTFNIIAQNQLFTITLTGNASAQPLTAVGVLLPALVTWQITQDGAGGHTFSWPANVIGGAPIGLGANQVTVQHFIWNGVNAIALGPATTGSGPSISTGAITANGNVSITGTVTATGVITGAGFYSATANAAASGTIRLAQVDTINWRNAGNTADEGLSTDSSDRLNISHANGAMLTGANPFMRYGGSTASFPMWKRVTTELQARLADDSASAAVSGSSLTFNGPVGTGVTISGACTTGQVLTAGSTTTMSCAGLPGASATILQASITTNTGTAIGNSDVTWVTKSVTMPSSGCPCRAFVSYSAMYTAGSSGGANFWVNDGTNNFAETQVITNSASGISGGASGASFSPVTYANNANVTFTGVGNTNAAGGLTIANPGVSNHQSPWLNVVIMTSN